VTQLQAKEGKMQAQVILPTCPWFTSLQTVMCYRTHLKMVSVALPPVLKISTLYLLPHLTLQRYCWWPFEISKTLFSTAGYTVLTSKGSTILLDLYIPPQGINVLQQTALSVAQST